MKLALPCCVILLVSCSPIRDFKDLLNSPAVQATIDNWNLEGDATNPSVGFYLVNGGEVRFNGFIARGALRGSRTGGLNPELYDTLVRIANERRLTEGLPPIEDATTNGATP
jgi:hypothetical protein